MKYMIMFDLTLYSPKAIRGAVNDYQKIAKIETEFKDNHCICHVCSSLYDIELTEKEFSNYVLDKTVSMGSIQ